MTENILENSSSLNPRLGDCEVCNDNPAKYTCPECEVKTCCLPCVKIHKKELDCSGIRNKVKFKPVNKFTNMDFQSDVIFLENATRATENIKKVGTTIQKSTYYSLPRMKIKTAARKRNIQLHYLPKHFTRHVTNTTYYNWKADKLYWKVEWVFPDSSMVSLVDERVPEMEPLITTLKKYIDPEHCEGHLRKLLSEYHNVMIDELVVLLKLERDTKNKFHLVDKDETLIENLSKKKIIEHPVFYVTHKNALAQYGILNTEIVKKDKYSNNFKGINLLFDTINNEESKVSEE